MANTDMPTKTPCAEPTKINIQFSQQIRETLFKLYSRLRNIKSIFLLISNSRFNTPSKFTVQGKQCKCLVSMAQK